jgi:hypothetical protein
MPEASIVEILLTPLPPSSRLNSGPSPQKLNVHLVIQKAITS